MHIPDGFINAGASLGAAVAATGGLATSIRATTRRLADRQIPVAGLAAAFIFVLQMLNFPVAAGTTGHLLGGSLAVVLLGPSLGITVVSVVVIVQAILFADGGISALGLNTLNIAIIPGLVGWGVFRLVMIRPTRSRVLIGTLLAGWASVIAASLAFSLEYMIGGRGGVNPSTVLAAMVGIHALIGIGEGLISTAVVASALVSRPDLVWGASRLDASDDLTRTSIGGASRGGFVAGGVAVAIALVVFVAPNAGSDPDGLQRVAEDSGFASTETDHALGGPLAGYVVGDEQGVLGTILAGLIGIIVTFALGLILVGTVRRLREREPV